jgi:transcriptional regulator with XRE-family HTH domain
VAQRTTRRTISSNVARILREERLKRALSMSAVAARAGLSQQMVSYVEREMRSPTLDTLLRITEALEISLAEVLRKAVPPKG